MVSGAMKAKGDYYITSPYVDARTNKMIISISKAFDTPEEEEGVISSDVEIDYLVDFLFHLPLPMILRLLG